MVTIIPAVLQLQRENLESEIERLSMISPFLHIDVTGALVDGPDVAFDEKELSEMLSNDIFGLQYQVHLMLTQEELRQWLPVLVEIDTVSTMIVHHEIGSSEVLSIAEMVRSANKSIIVAINPETSIEVIDEYIGQVDGVMVMAVVPGAQGKPFEPETFDRVAEVHRKFPQLSIIVDGAVSLEDERAQKLAKAGAEVLVVGSKIRDARDPQAMYDAFTAAVNASTNRSE